MKPGFWFWAAGLGVALPLALVATVPGRAEETPKYGGTLSYMIPAELAAQLRRAARGDLCDDPLGGAVLQRLDQDQPQQSGVDHRHRLRPVHRDAAAD